MSLISPDLLATFVYTSEDQMILAVFPWRNLVPRGQLTIEDALPLATTFQLPPAAEGWSYKVPTNRMYQESHGEITWDPQPKQQAYTETLFVPSDRDRSQALVRLLYNMEECTHPPTWRHIESSVHVPEFVLPSLVASRGAGQVVPWDVWGPNSRISRSAYTNRVIYGDKRVTIGKNGGDEETVKLVVDRFNSLNLMLKHAGADIVAERSETDFFSPWREYLFHHSALEKATLPYRSTTYDTGIICSDHDVEIVDVGDNCVILEQKFKEGEW